MTRSLRAKYVVYTCVFDDYDWVFPPLSAEDEIDYVIFTDNPGMLVRGWKTRVVDTAGFRNSKEANLHYRALSNLYLGDFQHSLYVDGNIRLIGKTSRLFKRFEASKSPFCVFRHPLRKSVQEEVECCLANGKVSEPSRLNSELEYQRREGFPDDVGLVETNALLKDHRNRCLADTMRIWSENFEQHGTRDQIGLPFAIWKTKIPLTYQDFDLRKKNPYFGLYTHRKDSRAPKYYGYVQGRAYDSAFYASLLKIWQLSWEIRRSFRKR